MASTQFQLLLVGDGNEKLLGNRPSDWRELCTFYICIHNSYMEATSYMNAAMFQFNTG